MHSSPHMRIVFGIIAVSVVLVVTACKPRGANSLDVAHALPPEGALAALPLGALAGAAALPAADEVANPLAGSATAIEDGHGLFIAMNCAGCHGYDAKGNMGPNLTDAYWRYGGTPAAIYNSIYDGRPLGMPAWGRALPAQDIWKIVAYLQSLGGAVAAKEYHAGLQGDHDLTSTAAEAHSLLGVFNNPSGSAAEVEGTGSTPTAPPHLKQDP